MSGSGVWRRGAVRASVLAVVVFAGGLAVSPGAVSAAGSVGVPVLGSDAVGSLTVAWETPSPTPDDYRLMWAPEGGDWLSYTRPNEAERGNLYPGGDQTSVVISGLEPGGVYRVKMRARYSGGRPGPWSAEASFEVKGAPRLSSDAAGSLTVTWDAPSPSPDDYRLMWAPVSGDWLSYTEANEAGRGNLYPGGDQTSATIVGLEPGGVYRVKMRARYSGSRPGPWSAESALEVSDAEPIAPKDANSPGNENPQGDEEAPRGEDSASNDNSPVDNGASNEDSGNGKGGGDGASVRQSSTDATLSALTASPVDISNFSATNTQSYQSFAVYVGADVETATIQATLNDSNASIDFDPGDADTETDDYQISLSVGRNAAEITVTAQDGTTQRVYAVIFFRASTEAFGWKITDDFRELAGPEPRGMWSDGTTMWVADSRNGFIHAYSLSDKTRDSGKDFASQFTAGNEDPHGMWSNGTTMWVLDTDDDKLFAYTLATRARDSAKDFDLDSDNSNPAGIWSDGTTMWVADFVDDELFAYTLATGARDSAKDFDLDSANTIPAGIWSDGATMWVQQSSASSSKLFAYKMSDRSRVSNLDFDLSPSATGASHQFIRGLWSDGATMWVSDSGVDDIFSYNLPVYPVSAKVLGTSLEVVFSQELAAAANLANSAFTVQKTPAGGTAQTVSLSGSPAVSGRTVTLTLASAVVDTDTGVQVDYTKPNSGTNNKLAGSGGVGVEVAAFTGFAVRQVSSDASLSALSVTPTDITGFDADVLGYEAGVGASVAQATVTWEPGDSFASVDVSPADADEAAAGHQVALSAGQNAVSIVVTADDGTTTQTYTVNVNRGVDAPYGWKASDDLDGLAAAGAANPYGVWSDGTTMWVAGFAAGSALAFGLADGARAASRDIDLDSGNLNNTGAWTDGTVVWVADRSARKLFAYALADGARAASRDVDLDADNGSATGVWSDGTTIWVADSGDDKLFAYALDGGARAAADDIALHAGNGSPAGVWSDGTTLWVADHAVGKLFAYALDGGARDSAKDFETLRGAGIGLPAGVWSDGATMWVAEFSNAKVYSFNMPVYPVSAKVLGTSLEVVFSQELSAAASLANSAFTVNKTPDGGSESEAALSGSPSISGRTLTLTLASAVAATDTGIKVAYTKPTSGADNKLAGSGGVEADTFADLAVRKVSSDASLSALSVSPTDITGFDAGVFSYEAGVGASVAEATVTWELGNSFASADVSPADADEAAAGHQVALSAGQNAVSIVVTADDGTTTQTYTVNINRGVTDEYGWAAVRDFDGLVAAGNTDPYGVGSDGTTVWVADGTADKLFAYTLASGARDAAKDIDLHADNGASAGIWVGGATVWVADGSADKLFAYTLAGGARDAAKDIDLHTDNDRPQDVWSDGTTVWVVEGTEDKLFAYTLAGGARDSAKDIDLHADNDLPTGAWSDGTTLWVGDHDDDKLFAYALDGEARVASRDFGTLGRAGNNLPAGVWSDGATVWVVDNADAKLYSYNLPVYAVSASAQGTSVTVTFSQDLAAAANLANGAFTVERTPVGGSESEAALSGSPAVSGRTVTLTLASAVLATDTGIKVGYTPPASGANNRLAGSGGNEVAMFEGFAVARVNNAPAFSPAAVTLRFDENTAAGSDIGSPVAAADIDAGEVLAYTLGGADAASFDIVASSGQIRTKAGVSYDYEAKQSYAVTVTVTDVAGATATATVAIAVDDTDEPPSAPSAPATAAGKNTVSVSWTAPANAGRPPITGYDLQYRQGTTGQWTDGPQNHPASPAVIGGLSPETSYQVRVRAANAEGDGPWSAPASFTTSSSDASLSALTLAPLASVGRVADRLFYEIGEARSIAGFDANTLFYEIGVGGDVAAVTVDARVGGAGARARITPGDASRTGGHQVALAAGSTTIEVTVTSEDGDAVRVYRVKINRGADAAFARTATEDFYTLGSDTTVRPTGVWSDGITMWVADDETDKLLAYDLATGARKPAEDFGALDAAGNNDPDGIWSDGATMWVADSADGKLYAYDLDTKARDSSKDFDTLDTAGNDNPRGLWSNRKFMWVSDSEDGKVYAYDMATKARDDTKDFDTLDTAGNDNPRGLWSDGVTMWVADHSDGKVYAYDMADKDRKPAEDFDTLAAAGNESPSGMWSNGVVLWVADDGDDQLYSYWVPQRSPRRAVFTVEPAAGLFDPAALVSGGAVARAGFGAGLGDGRVAYSFKTGPDPVKASSYGATVSPLGARRLTVSLHRQRPFALDEPGDALHRGTVAVAAGLTAEAVVEVPGLVELEPSTRYWIVIARDDGGPGLALAQSAEPGDMPDGWTAARYALASRTGGWRTISFAPRHPILHIDASAHFPEFAPDPSTRGVVRVGTVSSGTLTRGLDAASQGGAKGGDGWRLQLQRGRRYRLELDFGDATADRGGAMHLRYADKPGPAAGDWTSAWIADDGRAVIDFGYYESGDWRDDSTNLDGGPVWVWVNSSSAHFDPADPDTMQVGIGGETGTAYASSSLPLRYPHYGDYTLTLTDITGAVKTVGNTNKYWTSGNQWYIVSWEVGKLDATRNLSRAQPFQAGTRTGGWELHRVEAYVHSLQSGSIPRVTIHENDTTNVPKAAVSCTLEGPLAYRQHPEELVSFHAPQTGCTLASGQDYWVVFSEASDQAGARYKIDTVNSADDDRLYPEGPTAQAWTWAGDPKQRDENASSPAWTDTSSSTQAFQYDIIAQPK